jgi:hypothetical protein
MTETTLKQTFDGAQYVGFSDSGHTCVVWSGGITFNVYSVFPRDTTTVAEVDVFSLSNDEGNPVDQAQAEAAVEDYLSRNT